MSPFPFQIGLVTALTALVASVMGPLVTLLVARRQFRANVISTNRQKWIETFRDRVSVLLSLMNAAQLIKRHSAEAWRGGVGPAASLGVTDKFEKAFMALSEIRLLTNAADLEHQRLTIPSPSMLHYRGGRAAIDQNVYPDMDLFWTDLAAVYRREIGSLYTLGCRYLQLDDASLAYLNDPAQRRHVDDIGGHGEDQHQTYIRVLNDALRDRPADMTVCVHLCRGNFRSSWIASGGYDHVADALFNDLDVDGYFLEFDDERSGGFEPLRFLPKGNKRVVLGLVTTKHGMLETKDFLKRRVEEASRWAPLDQLCLSPQCGFSSTSEGNELSWEQQADKLTLVVETAEDIWGDV